MTFTLTTVEKTEKEIEIELPAYWKKDNNYIAIYSDDYAVEVFLGDLYKSACASQSTLSVKRVAAEAAARYTPCTDDDFNNALWCVTSNLIPIPDKEVFQLEQSQEADMKQPQY